MNGEERKQATAAQYAEWMKETPDPRLAFRITYPLPEILFVLFIGQLCGMDDVGEIVLFARLNLDWFKGVMDFREGIASVYTFRRVLGLIDPKAFEKLFTAWAGQWREGDVVALDGKCLRGASDAKEEHKGLYTVNAYGTQSGLVLGQHKVHEKSNEITAIPALLDRLSLEGAIVTIDAMGTQSKIAAAIRAIGADYALALKGNQGALHKDVADFFKDGEGLKSCRVHTAVSAGHGRIEERTVYATDAIDWLQGLHPQWQDLRSIIAVTATRTHKKSGKNSVETRFYISSLPPDPERLSTVIRRHWGIENNLHWSLDVTFGEDKSSLRDNAAANMAIIRKTAYNALKQDNADLSLKLKRLKAAHDPAYRSSLINLHK